MKVLLLASLLGACSTTGDFPVQPQGMPAAKGSSSTSNVIVGRACIVTDPRILNQCSVTGAGNLVVSLGSSTAMTAQDGSFQIVRAPGAEVPTSFTVSGSNIVTTSVPVVAAGTAPFTTTSTIPVLEQSLFDQLLATNGIAVNAGTGTIVSTVVGANGVPRAGVTAVTVPASTTTGPFFDGLTPTSLSLSGTGVRGVVFIPGVPTGGASVTFTDPALASETTVDGIQVIDGGITFLDSVVLP